MDVERLVAECAHWQKAKKHLVALSRLGVDEKRRLVYPRIVELTARLLTGVKDTGYALKTYTEFLVRELAEEPDLAASLYAAMRGPAVYEQGDNNTELYFFKLVTAARDPRAVGVLRETRSSRRWEEAVLAVDGASLRDELLSRLAKGDLVATAAGFFCGAEARDPLHVLFERRSTVATSSRSGSPWSPIPPTRRGSGRWTAARRSPQPSVSTQRSRRRNRGSGSPRSTR